jgi:N-terminal acetyltransferase B complex catalytic subunit
MWLPSSFTRKWGEFLLSLIVASFLLTTNIRYSVYRRILDYYADGADAFDMRKPLRRDKQRKTVRPNGENIKVDPSEVW